jgi:hypothetical protein
MWGTDKKVKQKQSILHCYLDRVKYKYDKMLFRIFFMTVHSPLIINCSYLDCSKIDRVSTPFNKSNTSWWPINNVKNCNCLFYKQLLNCWCTYLKSIVVTLTVFFFLIRRRSGCWRVDCERTTGLQLCKLFKSNLSFCVFLKCSLKNQSFFLRPMVDQLFKSNLTLCFKDEWFIYNRLFNANFAAKLKKKTRLTLHKYL